MPHCIAPRAKQGHSWARCLATFRCAEGICQTQQSAAVEIHHCVCEVPRCHAGWGLSFRRERNTLRGSPGGPSAGGLAQPPILGSLRTRDKFLAPGAEYLFKTTCKRCGRNNYSQIVVTVFYQKRNKSHR